MSLCAENCEDINKCWDEFKSIFSGTVFDYAPVKISSKNEQKAKPWITKRVIVSTIFRNLILVSPLKIKLKNSCVLKSIEIY